MSDSPFVAELMMVSFNFAPQGWAMCNGQLLPIAQNQALFSLLGTTYGGDGQTTFALPDLRGRVPMHRGANPGGGSFVIGEHAGTESVTLNLSQVPAHVHPVNVTTPLTFTVSCDAADADRRTPAGNGLATERSGVTALYAATDNANMGGTALRFDGAPAISNAGANQPHVNLQPFIGLNFCMALVGIFPTQAAIQG